MIQRIQSIFLLLASASAFALLVWPFASIGSQVSSSDLFQDGIYEIQDNIALLILFCLAGGLSFIAIFLFKNRKSQMRLTRLAIVFNIVALALAIVLIMRDGPNMEASVLPNDEAGAYMPFAFLLFAILALRFIKKDEKVVRSMDRLR